MSGTIFPQFLHTQFNRAVTAGAEAIVEEQTHQNLTNSSFFEGITLRIGYTATAPFARALARYNIRAVAENAATVVAIASTIAAVATLALGGSVVLPVVLVALSLLARQFFIENQTEDRTLTDRCIQGLSNLNGGVYDKTGLFRRLIAVGE